jgi:hypothetical protein
LVSKAIRRSIYKCYKIRDEELTNDDIEVIEPDSTVIQDLLKGLPTICRIPLQGHKPPLTFVFSPLDDHPTIINMYFSYTVKEPSSQ